MTATNERSSDRDRFTDAARRVGAASCAAAIACSLAACGGDEPPARSASGDAADGAPAKTAAAEPDPVEPAVPWADRIAIVASPSSAEVRRGDSVELVLRTLNVSGEPVSLERMNCSWFEDWRVVDATVPAFAWECEFDVAVVDSIPRDGFVEQRVSWSVDERWPLGEVRVALERMAPDGSVVAAPAFMVRVAEPDPERRVADAEAFILRTIRALPAPAAFDRLRERARIDAERDALRRLLEESLVEAERLDDRARAVAIRTVLAELEEN